MSTRPVSRQQLIAALADFAGPLGPLQSVEEQACRRDDWVAAADTSLLDAIVDVMVHPPGDAEFAPATRESFETELRQMLEIFAAPDPSPAVAALGPLLERRAARPLLIEAIGALGVVDGLRWLAPLVGDATLDEDEAATLACALGEIGGDEARGLLVRMRDSIPAEWQAARREIEIGLGSL